MKYNKQSLKAAMARAGYTQDKLSKAIGIARSTLWQKTESGNFTLNEAAKICDTLGSDDISAVFF